MDSHVETRTPPLDEDCHDGMLPSLGTLHLDANTTAEGEVFCESQKMENQKTSNSSAKFGLKLSKGGTRQSNCTIPRPFILATDKRSSGGSPTFDGELVGNGKKPSSLINMQPTSTFKKTEKNLSLLSSRKPLQPENKMNKDKEDVCSVASSTTAIKASKLKVLAASAPVFRSTERAEKRKEFYSNLEKKHQALEAEKNQCEARTKDEREAAIKQLRKSMTFRANPMPSFYHEEPPPKVEFKKVPPTRARSPKFGRRKSCGDFANPAGRDEQAGASSLHSRSSLGSHTHNSVLRTANTKKADSFKNTSEFSSNLKRVEQDGRHAIMNMKKTEEKIKVNGVIEQQISTGAIVNGIERGEEENLDAAAVPAYSEV